MNTIINQKTIDLAVEIQQIPAPTFHEEERAEFVRERFLMENDLDVETDRVGNVLACLPGEDHEKPILVSAHLDTVFPAEVNLRAQLQPDRIFGAGIGDNSLGVASLFGLLWHLRVQKIRLRYDLWLIANVCEEGLGDMRGMRAVVERFGEKVKAYIILEGQALGHIYHRGLGVRRQRITIRTAGGHSWTDHGHPSAVHELASLATKLTALTMPIDPRSTLNVGKITGGTSVNTIAAEACLELDLRSETVAGLNRLHQQVEEICLSFEGAGVQVDIEMIGERPAGELPADHLLVRQAKSSLLSQGIQPVLNIGSTDANLPLSLGYPAIALGLSRGGSAHTVHEYILTEPFNQGMEQVVRLVEMIGK